MGHHLVDADHHFVPLVVPLAAHLLSLVVDVLLLQNLLPVDVHLELLVVPGVDFVQLEPDLHRVVRRQWDLLDGSRVLPENVEASYHPDSAAGRDQIVRKGVRHRPSVKVHELIPLERLIIDVGVVSSGVRNLIDLERE